MNAPASIEEYEGGGPVRFSPSVEREEKDEAATINGLIATMRCINERTFVDGGHAIRSVHAKTHGILEGTLDVDANLPYELAQGVFEKPGRYPVVMRFSTIPGDILDDRVSTPRGLSIKIIGVKGERLSGSEGDVTQDFLLVNGPVFGAPTPKKFLPVISLLGKTTDRVEILKIWLSAFMRQLQRLIVAVTGQPNGTVATLGGHPYTHILGETFYSQAPLRFGDFIAKISAAPISSGLIELRQSEIKLRGNPNGLRQAVLDFFERNGGVWEVRAQLCTDLKCMPIENAAVVWPEEKSPFRAVARITVEPQKAWTEERSSAVDDGMQFSPWHGLAAHRPLGGIMRARRKVYEMAKRFRAESNGVVIEEPRESPIFRE